MTNGGEFQLSNLAFFERELWNSSVIEAQQYGVLHEHSLALVTSLYPFELASWLQIGSKVGFFESLQAASFLVNQAQVLQRHWNGLLSEGESLLPTLPDFIINKRNSISIDVDRFLGDRLLLQIGTSPAAESLFRTYILMNSELMGDTDATFFLEALNWSTDEGWSRIVTQEMWTGSLENLCRGMASLFNYFETARFADSNASDAGDKFALLLLEELHEIQRPRLGQARSERYFQLAATILGNPIPDGTQRLDYYRALFTAISSLLQPWTRLDGDEQRRCWDTFSGNLERSEERRFPKRRFNV
jgi:hypothetical protein